MFYRLQSRYLWGIFTSLLLLMLAVGCTSTPAVGGHTPPPPSSLTIDNNDGDNQDSTEDQTGEPEPVDSFIRTTQLIQAADGSAVVQVVTETSLDSGTYHARYYDSEGGENTAPCEQVEGSDNELQCSVALAGGFQMVEFQLFYLEPFEPIFSVGVDFTGTALDNLFNNVDGYILPPEFQSDSLKNVGDTNSFQFFLCLEWYMNDGKPDALDPYCGTILPWTTPGYNDVGGFVNNDLGWGGSHASTIPDPDCDGKDAGSFWCQETEEQQYLAGRLATTCLDQIKIAFEDPLTAFEDPLTAFEDPLTAFEDPLTAFEDPLTAFEDPLTAFEDPLTAFEDPLTAFEDPLTAVDVARTTIFYRVAYPTIPNPAPLTACNQLAMLGDHSQYLRTGETLLEYLAGYYPLFEPVTDRLPLDTSDLTVMPAHCGYYDDMQFESKPFIYYNSHQVRVDFDAAEPLPGLNYFVFGDPTPYYYSANLGGISMSSCSLAGDTGLRCDWDSLDESFFGQEQEYALYVTGCEEPLHTGTIILPTYDYNRCTVFEQIPMSLSVADPSPNLSISVAMPNGIPGLEAEDYPDFDNLPVDYYSRFCGKQTFCEVYDWLPGRLYCNLKVSPDCLTDFNEFELLVSQCGVILSRTLQIVAPQTGGDVGGSGGSGGSGSSCTGSEPNKYICEAHGGSWSGAYPNVGTCTCP